MILLLIKIQSSMLSLGMLIWAALPPTTIALLYRMFFLLAPLLNIWSIKLAPLNTNIGLSAKLAPPQHQIKTKS